MKFSVELSRYMRQIGQKGGLKSRRRLDPEMARTMVRVREARKLYSKYHSRCFWSAPPDFKPGAADLDWVAAKLRQHGGRDGWKAAEKLCP